MVNKPFKTGGKAPYSGQYRIVGFPGVEATYTKGETGAPYAKQAVTYVLVDKTNNPSNK